MSTSEPGPATAAPKTEVVLDCGWGRLLFGQTFDSHEAIVDAIQEEEPGRRDICMYAPDPHVLVSRAPQELFIDPSHTYRLWLDGDRAGPASCRGASIRGLDAPADATGVNEIYAKVGMVTAPTDALLVNHDRDCVTHLVAEDDESGDVIGTVTGIDHARSFDDPEDGSSLWCLAVDPQAGPPGIGAALVASLIERFRDRGRAYLDLSVMHDNEAAIGLYEKLGFERVPVFVVKRKNPINEQLFAGEPSDEFDRLNPYARIIADEALRRGIEVEVVDPDWGELRLSHGGRSVAMRESLSELTSAVAMARCADKRITRRVLAEADLRLPAGREAGGDDVGFLEEVGEVVVKPARGEQGDGVTVGVADPESLAAAIATAERFCPDVLLEERLHGQDLRVVVIDHEVVAAAVRRPAAVVGDGEHTVEELIAKASRRREAASGGESSIPLDEATAATVAAAGNGLDDVLDEGVRLQVRRTANLHTGGTIDDVTAELHGNLADVSVQASRALELPVVGLDLMVPEVTGPDYAVIEANERPGLANHEPQPTAQRYIDLLFPATQALPSGWEPDPF